MSKAIYAGMTKPDYSIPDGKYPARLFQIVQLGSQYFEKNGKGWYSPMILLGFELPTQTFENQDGETMANIKSGSYFLSMNPSYRGIGLREIIDGLRGSSEYTEEELEKFDISSFLGKECFLTLSGVESKGQTYQNITEVSQFTTGDGDSGMLKKFRDPILVTIEDFRDLDNLALPDWIKDKIRASKEWKYLNATPAMPNGQVGDDVEEIKLEDVPF